MTRSLSRSRAPVSCAALFLLVAHAARAESAMRLSAATAAYSSAILQLTNKVPWRSPTRARVIFGRDMTREGLEKLARER